MCLDFVSWLSLLVYHMGLVLIRAAGLIVLTRRLTRLSINRVKICNRALIVNFSVSHFSSCLITLMIDLRSRWITPTHTSE